MKPTHTLGLVLWRTGILIVAAYFVFLALRPILHITDPVLEIGVTLVLAGALFVLVSVVREQIEDARRERSYEMNSDPPAAHHRFPAHRLRCPGPSCLGDSTASPYLAVAP